MRESEMYSQAPAADGAACRKAFQAAFRRSVVPWLKQQGFEGSGATFRRYVDQAVHVVNLQARSRGGEAAVNLGVHFRFLPSSPAAPPPEKLVQEWCALRRRLAPQGESDFWWRYGNTAEEAAAAVEHMLVTLQDCGAAWFTAWGVFPGGYLGLTPGRAGELDGQFLFGTPLLAMAHVLAVHRQAVLARALVAQALQRVEQQEGVADLTRVAMRERASGVLALCTAD